jgi:hypothetical protein
VKKVKHVWRMKSAESLLGVPTEPPCLGFPFFCMPLLLVLLVPTRFHCVLPVGSDVPQYDVSHACWHTYGTVSFTCKFSATLKAGFQSDWRRARPASSKGTGFE